MFVFLSFFSYLCRGIIKIEEKWQQIKNDPPYTHNHMRLADGCGLYELMTEEQRNFLDTITSYNIEARYPEDKQALYQRLTKQFCRQMIDETKQLQQWIKDKL